jgi:hypothetical protein
MEGRMISDKEPFHIPVYCAAGAAGNGAGLRLLPVMRNAQVRSLDLSPADSTTSPSSFWLNFS